MITTQKQFGAFTSLAQMLSEQAARHADKPAFHVLKNGTDLEASLSFEELHDKAQALAQRLVQFLSPGDRAILLYPAGLDFVQVFFACLYAGIVPIPAPAPDSVQFKRGWPRLLAIIEDAQASHILTVSGFEPQLQDAMQQTSQLNAKILLTDITTGPHLGQDIDIQPLPDELAYLQYTSGSQSAPKGVMISHGNLIAHLGDLAAALEYGEANSTLNWMPHHHDYGLVQGLLLPFFTGGSCYIMSPTSFIRNPMRWLAAISKFRITHSQGTNFAYSYCLRKYTPSKATELDLSCWIAASVGAEPINPEVTRQFTRTFLSCGFRPGAFLPAYGMAEATLVVSTRTPRSGVAYNGFEAKALLNNRVVETENQTQRHFVSCGAAVSDNTVLRIIDPETCRPCQSNEVGEIWVSGPGVAQGYWQRPVETEAAFGARILGSDEGPFLRTGDQGFIQEGELFIAGRHKDLIIIRGQNHHPKDIEFAAEASHSKLREGRCAAFSIEGSESERLVVVAEFLGLGEEELFEQVIGTMTAAIGQSSELAPYAVVLIKSGSLPVTSSGKIQRQLCRAMFLQGNLNTVFEHYYDDPNPAADRPEPAETKSREPLCARLLSAPFEGDDETLRAYLISVLEEVLQTGDLGWIANDQSLLETGVDSISSVEIRFFIEEELDLNLPIDLLFRHSTLDKLIMFLRGELEARKKPAAEPEIETKEMPMIEENDNSEQTQNGKRRLLDWSVRERDREFDMTGEDLLSLKQITIPLNKTKMRRRGPHVITRDWAPKVPFVDQDTKVLGMGSCFTRDIILWLAETGFNRRFPVSPYNALLRYPGIGNNAYLSQQFQMLNKGNPKAGFQEADSRTDFLDAEKDEGRNLFGLLRDVDVLILTLGSLETWHDTRTGSLLKAPMLLADYSAQHFQHGVDNFADTLQHLEIIERVTKTYFPDLKLIFTLPVGRMASFRPMSAFNAASVQDATLRAALFEFLDARRDDTRLHYFPAYELFNQYFTDPYRADNVHATSFVTGKLCASFTEMFCATATQKPKEGSLSGYDPFFAETLAAAQSEHDAGTENQETQMRIASLEEQNKALQKVCDERMVVIEVLDKAVKDLQKKT